MKTCWFHRAVAVLTADEPSDAPAFVLRHRTQCPACRARAAREEAVGPALRAAARSEAPSAPPFLAARIAHRVAPSPRRALRPALRWQPWLASMAGILLVAGLVWQEIGKSPQPEARPHDPPSPAWTAFNAMTENWPPPERWLELGDRLDGSLNSELDAVVTDARSAVQYLAASFLPATPAAP